VVTFKRMYPSLLFPGKTQFDESANPLEIEPLRLLDSMNPLSVWKTARVIRNFDPTLVVFQWWHPFFAPLAWMLTWLLRRWTRAKIIFVCHNVLPHESSPVDRLLLRVAFNRVRRFIVHSQEDRRNLLQIRPGAAVRVNPLPLFDVFGHGRFTREGARRELEVEGRVVLYFGLVRAYKGLGVLLDAMARCGEDEGLTLLIVGEFYEDREGYMRQIESLGIGGRTRVVDRYVPNEEVEKYLLACDVLTLPYLSATQSAVVQVGFSYDKPVIVTAVGGLPDVVEDGQTGFVVPPADPDALAAAIRRFFDEGWGERMSRNIAAQKDRFSWARAMREILALARTASTTPQAP